MAKIAERFGEWREEGMVLEQLIEQRYESRADFARDLGVTTDVVSNLVRGITRLKGERRITAARLLHVDPVVFSQKQTPIPAAKSYEQGIRKEEVPVAPTGHRHVPIYGALAAGAMSYTYSDVVDWELMPEWGGDFERWGRIVSGSSMEPEFEEGDIVIFENRRHEDGHAVHAFAEGEDTFKIYSRTKDGERLEPLNPAFDALEAKQYQIKGIAIRRIRKGMKGVRDIREYPYGFRK
jgi:SOS-response transcriptional repressor LexA